MPRISLANLIRSVALAAALSMPATVAAKDPIHLVVYKKERIMQILSGTEVIRTYRVALGRNPVGPKDRAGDGKTPEGTYFIDRHNGASRFHKSLHISYPNSRDAAASRKTGHAPGGDIMIHGLPDGFDELADSHYLLDWTRGCIAVNNAEIDEIFDLVPDGTPVSIRSHL